MKRITKLLAFAAVLSCSHPIEVALANEQVLDLSKLSPVCTGQFKNSAAWQEVRFAVSTGRYVCVESFRSQNDDSWTSAAEIEALQPDGTSMDRSNWSIVFVSSEELMGENGAAQNVLDGRPNTIWHTKWKCATPSHPHYLVIDLKRTQEIAGLRILPRGDSVNGRIKDYLIYISRKPFPMKDKPKAPEAPPEVPTVVSSGWTPLQLSAFPDYQLVDHHSDVYGLGLGLVGENRSVHGLDIGVLHTETQEPSSGISLCGGASTKEKDFTGIQMALFNLNATDSTIWGLELGLLNMNGAIVSFGHRPHFTKTYGAQAGIFNFSDDILCGLQLGVLNRGRDDTIGLQVGGLNIAGKMLGITVGVLNANGEKSRCIQIGGFNCTDELDGMQASAINCADELYGVQAGVINSDYFWGEPKPYHSLYYTCGVQVGILNTPYNVRGLQIGLYNEAETLTGIQVGLVNVVYDGKAPFIFPFINARF